MSAGATLSVKSRSPHRSGHVTAEDFCASALQSASPSTHPVPLHIQIELYPFHAHSNWYYSVILPMSSKIGFPGHIMVLLPSFQRLVREMVRFVQVRASGKRTASYHTLPPPSSTPVSMPFVFSSGKMTGCEYNIKM